MQSLGKEVTEKFDELVSSLKTYLDNFNTRTWILEAQAVPAVPVTICLDTLIEDNSIVSHSIFLYKYYFFPPTLILLLRMFLRSPLKRIMVEFFLMLKMRCCFPHLCISSLMIVLPS